MNAYEALLNRRRDGSILHLTIDNYGRRNAITTGLIQAIVDIAEEEVASGASVLVLSGAGGVFCSGIDTKVEPEPSGPVSGFLQMRALRGALDDFGELPLVKIAQIDGYCLGAGVLLASHADIRIASTDTVFALPELSRGVPLSADGMATIVAVFGATRAVDLVLTGRRFSAAEALDFGFLTWVVENRKMAEKVTEYTNQLVDKAPYLLMQTILTAKAAGLAMTRTPSPEFGGELLAGAFRESRGSTSQV